MLQLFELRFKNIGRFVTEQCVTVDGLGTFIQVDGQNNNTGGSSGSGKSTIFMALDYLFGFNLRPATVLQSRKLINPEENAIWVHAVFTYSDGDDIVVITRSKSLVKITIGGNTYEKHQAEEQIDKLLGMPRDLFRKIIHKRQGEGGFFLDFGPKDMHNFLMDCIGLTPFKASQEKTEAELKGLELRKTTADSDVKINQQGLTATQDAIVALGLAPVQDIHREVIIELKEKHDRSAIRFADVQARCKTSLEEFSKNRPSIDALQYNGAHRETLEKRRKEIEAAIGSSNERERTRREETRRKMDASVLKRSQIVHSIERGERAKKEAAKIASEIKSIRDSKCYTCAQDWKTPEASETEKTKLKELSALKTVIDGAATEAEMATLDQEIEDLKIMLEPRIDPAMDGFREELDDIAHELAEEKRAYDQLYANQNEENRKKLDEFMAKQAEFRKQQDIELDQVRGQLDIDRRVLDAAVGKLKAYDEAKKRFETSLDALKNKEEFFTDKISTLKKDLENIEAELLKAEDSRRAIKEYVIRSFGKALDDIGERATKIIRCIPNTSNATIQFEGTRETKEGNVREEVNAVISVDGEAGVPIKSFSGGERSSIDLAVDLAVIDYIESKTGKGLNVFILDEPFNGLGTVEIEMALEVLKNSHTNKKLIIVDHNPEVKQMVQNRLVVVRDGLTSKVA